MTDILSTIERCLEAASGTKFSPVVPAKFWDRFRPELEAAGWKYVGPRRWWQFWRRA